MTTRSLLRLMLSLVCALLSLSMIWLVLERPPVQAGPLNAPSGITRPYPGASPCNATLQACISASADGDNVLVSPGTYVTASLSITRAVNLVGAGADPSAVKLRPTSGRMIQYSAATITNTTVISNLTVENGNSSGSSGGGIRVASGGAPLFHSIVVSNNIGTGGAGIRIIPALPVTMVNVTVFSNTSASLGGGISTAGDLTLIDSRIEGNSAAGDGGGIHTLGALFLSATNFVSNSAARGGGLYAGGATSIQSGRFERNVVSATNGLGGGLLVSGTLALHGTSFLTNSAVAGGGAYVSGTLVMSAAQFVSNTVVGSNLPFTLAVRSQGGGLYVVGPAMLSGGLFERNSAHNSGTGAGVFAASSLTVSGTQFLNNDAGVNSHGGGVSVGGTLAMTNGLFDGNAATDGGGGAQVNGAILEGVRFLNNRAVDGAGLRVLGNLAITNSQFIANIAGNNGGAIDWFNGPGTNGRIVDSLFARNSSGGGAALRLDGGGALAILFTTVADSSLNSGTAIAVSSGTVGITDSIIFNFAVGISQTGGTVREDYNLFFGNTNDRLGTITIGSHSFDLNPAFINPATDNYHLGPLSAAIDQGVDAGVYVDFDGDTRPIGAGFDIGFDERNAAAFKLYLPLIMR